eukprot:TRINITY_DN2080_c0_g1_i1.p1 TRINITY_DN2080_c0_g1~~TRINITY_DN2080_c0_g1_i1.p1  ORF type:complete len:140 (-),score=33.41 TRINITY_DN2080_c0_g1_i1:147-566(-)
MNSTLVLSPNNCHSLSPNDVSLGFFNNNSASRLQLSPPSKRANCFSSPKTRDLETNENRKLLKPKVLRLNQDLKKRLYQDTLIEGFVDGINDRKKKNLYCQLSKRIKIKIVSEEDFMNRSRNFDNNDNIEGRVLFKHKF